MSDIVTLRLDRGSQEHFDAMRREHFPPERNHIGAHVTLFHALPEEPWVAAALEEVARARRAFAMEVSEVRSLGKGVAYFLEPAQAGAVQRELAERFDEVLIAQDRQKFRPHVVVQNKVTPEVARVLLMRLQAGFRRWTVQAEGLELWHYRGGPWELVRVFPFGSGGGE